MKNRIRVGVAGLGFGANFAKIYQHHPRSELYAVCDKDEKVLHRWGGIFGIKNRFAGYRDMLALDEALGNLEEHEPRLAHIVECRCFGGLTVEETAEALAVSPATVKRGWTLARTWLFRELQTAST